MQGEKTKGTLSLSRRARKCFVIELATILWSEGSNHSRFFRFFAFNHFKTHPEGGFMNRVIFQYLLQMSYMVVFCKIGQTQATSYEFLGYLWEVRVLLIPR